MYKTYTPAVTIIPMLPIYMLFIYYRNGGSRKELKDKDFIIADYK